MNPINTFSRWLDKNYNEVLDITLFFGYVGMGWTLGYGSAGESIAFIQNLIYGTDRRFIGWTFFIIPSIVFLIRKSWVLKFALLAPLAFLLSGISWYLLVTPGRSVYIVVIFALALTRITIHYLRLIFNEYHA